MKNITKIVLCFVFLVSLTARSQNAPVTTAWTVVSPGPSVTVPVTVTNFVDIGAISLTLEYNTSIVDVSFVTPNTALVTGFEADLISQPGKIVMAWYGNGVTLANGEHLVDITFSGLTVGEDTPLTWIDDGTSCEYAKYNGGNLILLNDSPKETYYIDGRITYRRPAPVTIAPVYGAVPNTSICIPIKVVGFTNIGSISLTMNYNSAVLEFQGFTTGTIPVDWDFDVDAATAGTMIAGGYGPGFSLPDTSILFNACFLYKGGTTLLQWYDANVTACEYADAATLTPLYDLPQPTFYIDGVVTGTLVADFWADNVTPPKNTTVAFHDASTGGATSWLWSFDRSSDVSYVVGSSTSQNPQVKFLKGGPYTVTLTVSNTYLTDSEVKVDYIWVGIPGLWTGETSTDWYTTTNWDDWRVPTAATDVLIPPEVVPDWTVPNWPNYIGDFLIGTQCKTITLSDITSQMTVTGDIIF